MARQKLRVIIFEDDQAFSDLLRKVIQGFGHDVLAFPDPTVCPSYRSLNGWCRKTSPCADVLITDNMMPHMTGLEFLKLQRTCGCKAMDANKALMSAASTPEQENDVATLGCKFFKKPFRIADLQQWLQDCEARVADSCSPKVISA